MAATPRLRVIELGVVEYGAAWARQLEEVERRKVAVGADEPGEDLDDVVLLVEHPHVITVGRSRAAAANVVAPGDVPVLEIERGGDATYHGPGQVVAYPIVRLREGERDLHRFLRNLEEAMIRTLARFELAGGRADGKTGVWLGERKVASIGIACRRWITFHGLALNVSTDLSYFARINPCGFDATVMTSMSEQLGRPVAMPDVKAQLVSDLRTALGRS